MKPTLMCGGLLFASCVVLIPTWLQARELLTAIAEWQAGPTPPKASAGICRAQGFPTACEVHKPRGGCPCECEHRAEKEVLTVDDQCREGRESATGLWCGEAMSATMGRAGVRAACHP